MNAPIALGFFVAGLVCGMVLQAAATVRHLGGETGLWNNLRPGWLKRWAREAAEQANADRAHRRVAEMDTEI